MRGRRTSKKRRPPTKNLNDQGNGVTFGFSGPIWVVAETVSLPSSILAGVDPNTALRYLNDVTVIWKATDKLTLTTDMNYIRDDGFNATGYGVAQYATYTINDWLKITGRGEVWRDNNGLFVASFPGNLDFVGIEHDPFAIAISGGATTYAELTVGLAIKPPVPKQLEGLTSGLRFATTRP
jgi:hypothetical protein